MIQRAWQVLPDFGALISRLIRMLANQMLAQTWMPHSSWGAEPPAASLLGLLCINHAASDWRLAPTFPMRSN